MDGISCHSHHLQNQNSNHGTPRKWFQRLFVSPTLLGMALNMSCGQSSCCITATAFAGVLLVLKRSSSIRRNGFCQSIVSDEAVPYRPFRPVTPGTPCRFKSSQNRTGFQPKRKYIKANNMELGDHLIKKPRNQTTERIIKPETTLIVSCTWSIPIIGGGGHAGRRCICYIAELQILVWTWLQPYNTISEWYFGEMFYVKITERSPRIESSNSAWCSSL